MNSNYLAQTLDLPKRAVALVPPEDAAAACTT